MTHGAGVGSILLDDFSSIGGDIALGNDESGAAIRVRGGRLADATLDIDGRGITMDGLTITGRLAGVRLMGQGNTLQNVLMTGMDFGFRGHQAAITEGGRDNRIRSCTVVMDPGSPDFDAALSLIRRDSRLRWEGNVFLATGTVVRTWFAGFDPSGFAADANAYGPAARFDDSGTMLSLAAWPPGRLAGPRAGPTLDDRRPRLRRPGPER